MNEQAVFDKYGDIIRNFRAAFPSTNAVIAGGAIRDTLLGREVKDIDIIVEDPVDIGEIELHFGIAFRRIRISRAEYDDGMMDGGSTLLYVLESVDKAINVLVVLSVDEKIRSFPDSISQASYDGFYLTRLPAFYETLVTKVVRYAPRTTGERLARLNAKYGAEYTFHQEDYEIIA